MRLRALAAATLCAAATGASAQAYEPFALQSYDPPPAGDRFLALRSPDVPEGLDLRAGLVLSWASHPLVLRVGGTVPAGGEIVRTQFWSFLQVAGGFFGRVLVDVSLPVALYQSGSRPLADLPQVASAGVGDLAVGARLRLPSLGPVRTALAASIMLPTGTPSAYASDGAPRVGISAVGGGEWGRIDYGAELGLLWRSTRDGALPATGPGLTWRLGAAWRQGSWRFGPELYGRYQFEGAVVSPAEYLVAAHRRIGAWEASLGAGGQFDKSAGAAPLRVVARATWYPGVEDAAAEARRAAAAKSAQEKAEADRLAAEQAAREKAEADRLAADQAAREKAEADRLAAEQAAREKAEADRLAAAQAAAAIVPVVAENLDRDGDGILNAEDACPDEKGVSNADPRRNGCLVTAVFRADKIEILQSIQFEIDKDVLRPASTGILRDVANILQAHPEVERVRIEGHTDAQGNDAHNLRLSEARARAVKLWLVEQGGIVAARLETRGYGHTRPIATQDTAEGRARNRRVEFKIEQK